MGPSYTVTSVCPSDAAAGITCGNITCAAPGVMVPLAGLCGTKLAGATITYRVNGAAATTVTCPQSPTTVTVQARSRWPRSHCQQGLAPATNAMHLVFQAAQPPNSHRGCLVQLIVEPLVTYMPVGPFA